MLSAPAGNRLLRRAAGAVVAYLTFVAVAGGCGGTSASEDGRPTVVTSVYPLTWLARQVAGDAMQVRNLAGSQADPHHLELTPRQIVEVERAETAVYIKRLQPAMDEAVAQHGNKHALDVSSVVDVLSAADGSSHVHGGHAHGGSHTHDGGHATAFDPHIWLDPVRFATVAQQLGERFAAVDPAHADAYEKRADQIAGDLRDLDRAYSAGLRDCDSRTLVTSHSAFAYTAQRYDLHQVGIADLDPEVEPSPSRLARVTRLVTSRNIDVVFYDRSGSAELASVVAEETGARTAALDTITYGQGGGAGGYLAGMRANLEKLRQGLECS